MILGQLSLLVNSVNRFLWDNVLILLLCGTGIYFTLCLSFIQIRYFHRGWKILVNGLRTKSIKADNSGMSSFQAVATAVSGQIGTGNLAGPATAIVMGGPGAIFWLWLSSFLGMATIYAEAILAQKFKKVDKTGQIVGGPAYYIEAGLKSKWLAALFAILCILALGLIGNMVQANSIASAFNDAFGIPKWIIGIVVALICGSVIIKGIRSVAAFSERVVPIMAGCYLVGAIIILSINYQYLLPALKMIFIAAFNPEAVLGGGAGIAIQQAMRFGIARGLFANEAGMGSTPHAHAAAKVNNPEQQGFVAMMGVFIVMVIVTITALIILTSALKSWTIAGKPTAYFIDIFHGQGITLTQQACRYVLGDYGGMFIAISLFFFAFTTIIGWYYYAEVNVRYLFASNRVIKLYRLLVITVIFLATLIDVQLVWNMADMFNGLMVLPNLVALLLLSPMVIQHTKNYYRTTKTRRDH